MEKSIIYPTWKMLNFKAILNHYVLDRIINHVPKNQTTQDESINPVGGNIADLLQIEKLMSIRHWGYILWKRPGTHIFDRVQANLDEKNL